MATPIGQALADLLARKGWDAAELARRMDKPHATVWRWLHGRREPSAADVASIAEIAGEQVVVRFTPGTSLADRLALVEGDLIESEIGLLEVLLAAVERRVAAQNQEAG